MDLQGKQSYKTTGTVAVAHSVEAGRGLTLPDNRPQTLVQRKIQSALNTGQGRTPLTAQLKEGARINDDTDLEKEADMMGSQAYTTGSSDTIPAMKHVQLKSDTVQRAPFNDREEEKDTNALTFKQMFDILGKSKASLDQDTITSLQSALQKDLAVPPAASTAGATQKKILLQLISKGLLEVEADRLLLDIRILNLSQRLQDLDALPEAGVEKVIRNVSVMTGKLLTRDGLEATQSYLKNLISALDHAKNTDAVISLIVENGLLDTEGAAASAAREESQANVAGAIISTNRGMGDVLSVSGTGGGRLAREASKSGDPVLTGAAAKLIGPSRKGGRYSAKATKFFDQNSFLLEHTRDLDSEAQILDYFLSTILRISNSSEIVLDRAFDEVLPAARRNAVHGVILIHSDRTPCLSCGTIIDIFRKDFPNVQVFITFRRDYSARMEGRFQTAVMGGTQFQYSFLKSLSEAPRGIINPEERSTDKERQAYLAEQEKKQREALERERARESERKQVKAAVKDERTQQADAFLQANLGKLKAPEKAAFDKFVTPIPINMQNLLREIVAAKNDVAKLAAIKSFLKPFIGR